jgi:lipoate-protein ligase A
LAVCFDAPSWYELVVEGRKIAGSAQTRQKGVILQISLIATALSTNAFFILSFRRSFLKMNISKSSSTAGSAQTRQKGVILQHGSLLQDVNVDELFDMFIFKNDRLKDKMKKAFVDKAVALSSLSASCNFSTFNN